VSRAWAESRAPSSGLEFNAFEFPLLQLQLSFALPLSSFEHLRFHAT
jgi:hypothetical protein